MYRIAIFYTSSIGCHGNNTLNNQEPNFISLNIHLKENKLDTTVVFANIRVDVIFST